MLVSTRTVCAADRRLALLVGTEDGALDVGPDEAHVPTELPLRQHAATSPFMDGRQRDAEQLGDLPRREVIDSSAAPPPRARRPSAAPDVAKAVTRHRQDARFYVTAAQAFINATPTPLQGGEDAGFRVTRMLAASQAKRMDDPNALSFGSQA